ncbi:molybdenum ABC transporter ATP-binding protein ModC [Vibrio cionasavignyae]|uniref:molybdenum ABC transporter ATP-binding protein ModC n=1 Tax=Vibrio cionasavignyae TaxID=2910252 RepID=UPI003D14059B
MKKIQIDVHKQLSPHQFHFKAELPAKGITAVFGRSGAGKTTFINLLCGLTPPDNGNITVQNTVLFCSQQRVNVPIEKRKIGYVFQDARLFPHMKVRRNLCYGVTLFDQAHFDEVLSLLSIGELLERYPSELSGGEKQRVAIGRALLSKPDLLLMDEPLASLDLPRKREVMPYLERLSSSIDIPIIYVTHSLNEILRLAQHLIVIEQGEIVESGSIEKVWRSPSMQAWQSFSDKSALFKGQIIEQSQSYALTKIALNSQSYLWVQHTEGEIGELVRLRVRASDVSIALERPTKTSIRNILACNIKAISMGAHGSSTQSVEVVLGLGEDSELVAVVTQWAVEELELMVGQRVYAQIKGVSVAQRDVALDPHF